MALGVRLIAPFGLYYVAGQESVNTDIKSLLSQVGKRVRNIGDNIRTEAVKTAPVVSASAESASERMNELELWTELERIGWPIDHAEAVEKTVRIPLPPQKKIEADSLRDDRTADNTAGRKSEKRAEKNTKTADEGQSSAADVFRNLDRDAMREVFSQDDLNDLEKLKKEETHIYSSKKINQAIGEKPKKKYEPEQETTRPNTEETSEPVDAGYEYTERDYQPIRRNRYYRTGLLGGLMYFGFVVCISVILASLAWLAADDVLSLNKEYAEAQVYVADPVNMDQVSTELTNKGLIKYKFLFRLFGKFTKAENKIDPGTYVLSTKLDYNAMIHEMEQSDNTLVERETVTVMIPEGKTLKQTFQILAERGVCPYETLLECSANYEFKYEFLSDIPYGEENRLEGYLFPDTYQFFTSSSPEEAISKFLDNFQSKMTEEMRQKCAQLGYSEREILTIASLIEMEAGTDTERATISSVIFNRLSSSYYPYLQIDATVQYALEERKENLTYADLEVDSPYNTYKYQGLPPGPIANPGLASIRAALNPEYTGYYFYALNKNGTHEFFSTYSQLLSFKDSSEFGG